MITIIHGDDISNSREFLNKQAATFDRFDAANLDIDEIRQVLKGDGLFGSDKNILVENLFSKKAKNFEEITTLINQSTANIFIFDSREITAKNLKLFPKSTINIFAFPRTLFSFLDGIIPGNKRIVALYNDALKTTDIEILNFMIIRQIRILLALKTSSRIEEAARLAPWQKSKLLRQADLFGITELKKIYFKIFELDEKSKSGGLSLPIKESIDLFLLSL